MSLINCALMAVISYPVFVPANKPCCQNKQPQIIPVIHQHNWYHHQSPETFLDSSTLYAFNEEPQYIALPSRTNKFEHHHTHRIINH
uniref:Uncharacterized protein n=1 Tax=Tetranychus urticae TaxID=32264 RepID=T1KRH9_TETUR